LFTTLIIFFPPTPPTEIYTLSLHDALPISALTHWQWEKCLGIACSLFRGHYVDRRYQMDLELERNTRDYLYGRLLAIAEEIEGRSEEHTSELQSRGHLVCRLLLEKKN